MHACPVPGLKGTGEHHKVASERPFSLNVENLESQRNRDRLTACRTDEDTTQTLAAVDIEVLAT
jgi:hypothetical protein